MKKRDMQKSKDRQMDKGITLPLTKAEGLVQRLWLEDSRLTRSRVRDGPLDPIEPRLLKDPTPGIFSSADKMSSPPSSARIDEPMSRDSGSSGDRDSTETIPLKMRSYFWDKILRFLKISTDFQLCSYQITCLRVLNKIHTCSRM